MATYDTGKVTWTTGDWADTMNQELKLKEGMRVRMIPGNEFEYQARFDGKLVEGTITSIKFKGFPYTVHWDNDHKNNYTKKHITAAYENNRQALGILTRD